MTTEPRRVPSERYTSREFLELEWTRMWRRVWLLAAHESEVGAPGEWLTTSMGDDSLLVVRGDDRRVRVFANVCPHRGNLLCSEQAGRSSTLRCAYHHWTYGCDGALVSAPRARVNVSGVRLAEFRSATFAGFVWVYLGDDEPEPISEYLGSIASDLAVYRPTEWTLEHATTVSVACNWKNSADASNEGYHLRTLHPELMCLVDDDDIVIEPRGRHSAIRIPLGTPAQGTRFEGRVSPELRTVLTHLGADLETFDGTLADVRPSIVRGMKLRASREQIELAPLDDQGLGEKRQFHIFPNVQLNFTPFALEVYRHRPHRTDPAQTWFDELRYVRTSPATAPHQPPRRRSFAHGEAQLGPVMSADVNILPGLQRGQSSSSFRELLLTPLESPIAHLHDVLDSYLARPA